MLVFSSSIRECMPGKNKPFFISFILTGNSGLSLQEL